MNTSIILGQVILLFICFLSVYGLKNHNSEGDSLDVSIVDNGFPQISLVPFNSINESCVYTLTGIFESRAHQSFFDPRVDTDIADTRIILSDISWSVERRDSSIIALVGSPRVGSIPGNQKRFSSLEIIFTLNSTIDNSIIHEAVTGIEMHLNDYSFIAQSIDESTIVVFEWSLSTGSLFDSDKSVERNRKQITAGNCIYNAGVSDAVDDVGVGVRCEVRFSEKDDEDSHSITLFQSYAHFMGSVVHPGMEIVAKTDRNAAANKFVNDSQQQSPFSFVTLFLLPVSFISLLSLFQ